MISNDPSPRRVVLRVSFRFLELREKKEREIFLERKPFLGTIIGGR